MTPFEKVQQLLDAAIAPGGDPEPGPHAAFWRGVSRDEFVTMDVLGLPIITLGNGAASNLILALRGQSPFGKDQGVAGAIFRRMPAGLAAMPPADIAYIQAWIDAGCPDDEVLDLHASIDGAAPGDGFLLAPANGRVFTHRLRLKLVSGGPRDVTIRSAADGATVIACAVSSATLSTNPTEIDIHATSSGASRNDSAIEVIAGSHIARIPVTIVERPRVQFSGRFQCRLATDPDRYDDPWGSQSSFGMYAVSGPDTSHPDEPPLDRIFRFQDSVALRPHCAPIGVHVRGIEAQVGGTTLQFESGDAILGLPVRLGPRCTLDARDGAFALPGFEPISEFQLSFGTIFSGQSAPGLPRNGSDPPPSTAPYADGFFRLDQIGPWKPADFGYPEPTWAAHAKAVTDAKIAALNAEVPATPAATRIRDRRIQEHLNNVNGIRFALRMVERYDGVIDRDIIVAPGVIGVLSYFASSQRLAVHIEFFDFDSDCQCGTVTGTLEAV